MFNIGDKVKFNINLLDKRRHVGDDLFKYEYPDTTKFIKENINRVFEIVNTEKRCSGKHFLLNIKKEDGFGLIKLYKEEDLILVDNNIKNGSQVKLNHAVLEKRIHELDLAFVGHSKLNPNFIYTVVGKELDGDKFVVGSYIETPKDLGVVWDFLEKDELILVEDK